MFSVGPERVRIYFPSSTYKRFRAVKHPLKISVCHQKSVFQFKFHVDNRHCAQKTNHFPIAGIQTSFTSMYNNILDSNKHT